MAFFIVILELSHIILEIAKQKECGQRVKTMGNLDCHRIALAANPEQLHPRDESAKEEFIWDVTAQWQKNRLIRSESMPGHCGHLPCRMTSSGCLNIVCNPSLDFEETPGPQTSNLHG